MRIEFNKPTIDTGNFVFASGTHKPKMHIIKQQYNEALADFTRRVNTLSSGGNTVIAISYQQ